jgi:hypothetical protein
LTDRQVLRISSATSASSTLVAEQVAPQAHGGVALDDDVFIEVPRPEIKGQVAQHGLQERVLPGQGIVRLRGIGAPGFQLGHAPAETGYLTSQFFRFLAGCCVLIVFVRGHHATSNRDFKHFFRQKAIICKLSSGIRHP